MKDFALADDFTTSKFCRLRPLVNSNLFGFSLLWVLHNQELRLLGVVVSAGKEIVRIGGGALELFASPIWVLFSALNVFFVGTARVHLHLVVVE